MATSGQYQSPNRGGLGLGGGEKRDGKRVLSTNTALRELASLLQNDEDGNKENIFGATEDEATPRAAQKHKSGGDLGIDIAQLLQEPVLSGPDLAPSQAPPAAAGAPRHQRSLTSSSSFSSFGAQTPRDFLTTPLSDFGFFENENGEKKGGSESLNPAVDTNALLRTPQHQRMDPMVQNGLGLMNQAPQAPRSHQKPLEMNREIYGSASAPPPPFMMTINEASFRQSPGGPEQAQPGMGRGLGMELFSPASSSSLFPPGMASSGPGSESGGEMSPFLDITNDHSMLHSDLTSNFSSFNVNSSMGSSQNTTLSPALSASVFPSPDPNAHGAQLGVQNLSPMGLSTSKFPTQAYFSNNRAFKFKQGVSAALRSPKILANPKLGSYLKDWADKHETSGAAENGLSRDDTLLVMDDVMRSPGASSGPMPNPMGGPPAAAAVPAGGMDEAAMLRRRRALQQERMRMRGVNPTASAMFDAQQQLSPYGMQQPAGLQSPGPFMGQQQAMYGRGQPPVSPYGAHPAQFSPFVAPAASPALSQGDFGIPFSPPRTTTAQFYAQSPGMHQNPFLAQHFMSLTGSPAQPVGSYAVDQNSKIVAADNANGCSTGILRNLRAPGTPRGAGKGGPPSALPKEVIQSLYETIMTEDQDGKPKKVYACLIEGCNRIFPRRTACESHIQTHLEDKPYACKHEGCNARFVRPHDLRRHERTHSSKRPFRCPCGKGFARGDALMRHRHRGICNGAFTEEEKHNPEFMEEVHQEALRMAREEDEDGAEE